MNSLSWMIYLADLVGSIKQTTGIILIAAAVIACMTAIFFPLISMEMDDAPVLLKKAVKPFVITVGAALFLYVITPSTNTVYAIAASEMGEEVIKSPEVSKARQALNAWLDKQIQPEKAK